MTEPISPVFQTSKTACKQLYSLYPTTVTSKLLHIIERGTDVCSKVSSKLGKAPTTDRKHALGV